MSASRVLHTHLEKSLPEIHICRLNAVNNAVDSLLHGGKLTVTSIGRNKQGSAKVKHKIKSIDRLLSNGKLHSENLRIQNAAAQLIIGARNKLRILIDWSVTTSDDFHVLRASLDCKGRSLTLYEEVYAKKYQGSHVAHIEFLKHLKEIIRPEKDVIIITDAGFRADFFGLVKSHGWNFLGRVRTDMYCSFNGGKNWQWIEDLYKQATYAPKYLGKALLTKAHNLECHLFIYKEKKKIRKQLRKTNQGKMEQVYKKSHTDPWLLATSLPNINKRTPKEVVNDYRKRMKIEHDFRDMKDQKWGLGLNLSRTTGRDRLQNLLLLAMLALYVLYLIGLAAEAKNLQYGYQVNSIHGLRVLSITFLALQILTHGLGQISTNDLKNMLKKIAQEDFHDENA